MMQPDTRSSYIAKVLRETIRPPQHVAFIYYEGYDRAHLNDPVCTSEYTVTLSRGDRDWHSVYVYNRKVPAAE